MGAASGWGLEHQVVVGVELQEVQLAVGDGLENALWSFVNLVDVHGRHEIQRVGEEARALLWPLIAVCPWRWVNNLR